MRNGKLVPIYVRPQFWDHWHFQAMTYLDAKTRARLPNSAFAYVDSRGRRRLPINDEAHVRNALSRFNQTTFEDELLTVWPDDLRVRVRVGLHTGRPTLTTLDTWASPFTPRL